MRKMEEILGQWFSNFGMHENPLESLFKSRVLIPQVLRGRQLLVSHHLPLTAAL